MNIIVNLVLSILAFVLKTLTLGGAVTAFLVGFFIYTSLGLKGWLILLFFFISSVVLGKISKKEKSEKRDFSQVIANGAIAAFSALYWHYSFNNVALIMFGSSIASVTSDTWASEVGFLTKGQTFSILNFRRVEKGSSGGVSFLGTVSSVVASLVVATLWYASFSPYFAKGEIFLALIVALSGVMGSLVDSFMGATLQGHYLDEENNKVVEKDSGKFPLIRGFRWVDNDVVNLVSNGFGVGLSVVLSSLLL